MSVRIQNHCQAPMPPRVEKFLQKLLSKVPQEHLAGLEVIVLVDQVSHKQSRRSQVLGLYWRKWKHRPATIELALGQLYRGKSRSFFYLPFFAEFALATVLYHEIGHHYRQRLTHGVTEQRNENFADEYTARMLRKVFPKWFLVIRPMWRLIRWLKRSRKAKQGHGLSVLKTL